MGKLPLFLYVGHEDKDGAAQSVADALVDRLKENDLGEPTIQKLSDRKAFETVKKMPKGGVALVVVDSAPEGLCSAGKKLARNMTVELDQQGLKEKGIRYMVLTVATSSSAAALKNQVEQNAAPLGKAFDRAGCLSVAERMPSYVDAGIDDPAPVLDEICRVLCDLFSETLPGEKDKDIKVQKFGVTLTGPMTVFLCTGDESRDAAQALTEIMRTRCSVEEATLANMVNAAQQGTQVVLAVDCAADSELHGSLSDGARALSQQLSAAPAAMQAELQKLRFALLTVVATGFGNAGERANANAARREIARAVDPIAKSLEKCAANCVSSSCLDLQDASENTINEVCESIKSGFGMASDDKLAVAIGAA